MAATRRALAVRPDCLSARLVSGTRGAWACDSGYDEPVEATCDGAGDELPHRAEVACVGLAHGAQVLGVSFLKMMAGGYPRRTRIRLSSSRPVRSFPSRKGWMRTNMLCT